MQFVKIEHKKYYKTPDIIAAIQLINNTIKIRVRIKESILNEAGIYINDLVDISYAIEDSHLILLQKSEKGSKISKEGRLFFTCPFEVNQHTRIIDVTYELKEDGLYLYFKTSNEVPLPEQNISTAVQSQHESEIDPVQYMSI